MGVVETTASNFGEFLRLEIRKRGMSHRKFAELVGVSPQVINKFVDYDVKEVGYPSLDVLIKIAKATQVDIATLIALIEPDATQITPRARLLAQLIEQLPEAQRNLIDTFLLGAKLKEHNKTDE